METLIRISIWLIVWIVVKGVFYRFLERGESYVKSPLRTSLYFLCASLIVYFLFPNEIHSFTRTITVSSVSILLVFLCGAFLYYILCDTYMRVIGLKRHHLLLAQMNQRYLFSKIFEVLFQQMEIVVLVALLQSIHLPFPIMVFVFALLFASLHIPLIKLKSRNFGIYFTIAALLSSFAFPYCILFIPGGIIYSFMIHITFYLFSGALANGVSHYRTRRERNLGLKE